MDRYADVYGWETGMMVSARSENARQAIVTVAWRSRPMAFPHFLNREKA